MTVTPRKSRTMPTTTGVTEAATPCHTLVEVVGVLLLLLVAVVPAVLADGELSDGGN